MTTVQFQLGGTLKFLVEEPQGYATMTVTYDRFTITAKGQDMAYTLPNDMQVVVKVGYVDSRGNPAKVDGAIVWGTSDPAIATVVTDPGDSMKAAIRPAGPVGQVQITATADADLGEGTRALITTMDVDVVAGEAVAGVIVPVGEAVPLDTQVEPH